MGKVNDRCLFGGKIELQSHSCQNFERVRQQLLKNSRTTGHRSRTSHSYGFVSWGPPAQLRDPDLTCTEPSGPGCVSRTTPMGPCPSGLRCSPTLGVARRFLEGGENGCGAVRRTGGGGGEVFIRAQLPLPGWSLQGIQERLALWSACMILHIQYCIVGTMTP